MPSRPTNHTQIPLAKRSSVTAFQDQIVVIAEHRKRRVRRLWEWALKIAVGAIAGGKIHEPLPVIAALAAWARFEDDNRQSDLHGFMRDNCSAHARADHHHVG